MSPWPELPRYVPPQDETGDLQKYLPIALTIAGAISRGTSGNRARRREAVPKALQNLDYLRQIRESQKAEAEAGAQRTFQGERAAYTDAVSRRKQEIDIAQSIFAEQGRAERLGAEYDLRTDLARLGSDLNVEEIEARGEENRKTAQTKFLSKGAELDYPTNSNVLSYYRAQNPKVGETEKMFTAMAISQQTGRDMMEVYAEIGKTPGMTKADFDKAYWELFYSNNPKALEADLKDLDAKIAKMTPEEIEALKDGGPKDKSLYRRIQARYNQQSSDEQSTFNRLDAILIPGQ